MAHVRRGRKRIRAHANPFSDADVAVPLQPSDINWIEKYQSHEERKGDDVPVQLAQSDVDKKKRTKPNICDIGCGFGGLILSLSAVLPDSLIVGLEIRPQAVAIVEERIQKARAEGKARNICVVKCNVMKHFSQYFHKGQLDKIFFTFPDPHFKKGNFRRRIINQSFLAYYAYALKLGGICYTVTDVEDLFKWQTSHLDAHPLFERIPDEEIKEDPCFIAMTTKTDEAKKVERLHGSKFSACYRRVKAPSQAPQAKIAKTNEP